MATHGFSDWRRRMEVRSFDGRNHRSGQLKTERAPLTAMLLLLVVAAVQFIHYYPLLPQTIATHFGASGRPDGWSDKGTFFIIYGAIEVAAVAGAFVIARFARRIPTSALNIPNRDYWLAPDRRSETLSFVWNHVLWIETATVAFLVVVAEVMFRTNLGPSDPSLPVRDFVALLIVFIAVTAWLSLRIFTRFRLPRSG